MKVQDSVLNLPKVQIVLGGARSGKSAFAEKLVRAAGKTQYYIATAQAFDDEMRVKIDTHVADRGAGWITIEEPLDLAGAIAAVPESPKGVILIDCLTLWLSNLLLAERNLAAETDGLLSALHDCPHEVICVSNELGMGLVPDNILGRQFRDAQGRLNQAIAARAGAAFFVVAGLPIVLKGDIPWAAK